MGELINYGEHPVNCKGLDKREYMATNILSGMMPSCRHEKDHLQYAVQAVAYADALLEAFYSQSKFKTMIQVTVKGKTRVIRDKQIHYQTENDLECTYKDHRVCIAKQEATNDFYVTVTDKTGMYAVHGGFGGDYCRYGIETIEDCLVMCIENILI